MNKTRHFITVLAFAAFTIALSSAAQAQATRTWVSGVGDDVNPCSRTAPCKTYAGAISKTAKDGEISTLDPGGFGAVTITKSITINGTSGQGYGSILASSTTGVIVNITDVNDLRKTVRLNWLDINGAPSSSPGFAGIRVLSANAVHVENTVVDSFRSTAGGGGHGIVVASAGNTQLHVRNSSIRNNLNDGIHIENSGNQALVSVVNSKISGNNVGINAVARAAVTVSGCEISANTTTGIQANETENVIGVQVNVEGCVISFSQNGVLVGANQADVRLSNNFITQNGTGISNTGTGRSFSSGNNRVIGNGTNGAPNQPVVVPI